MWRKSFSIPTPWTLSIVTCDDIVSSWRLSDDNARLLLIWRSESRDNHDDDWNSEETVSSGNNHGSYKHRQQRSRSHACCCSRRMIKCATNNENCNSAANPSDHGDRFPIGLGSVRTVGICLGLSLGCSLVLSRRICQPLRAQDGCLIAWACVGRSRAFCVWVCRYWLK